MFFTIFSNHETGKLCFQWYIKWKSGNYLINLIDIDLFLHSFIECLHVPITVQGNWGNAIRKKSYLHGTYILVKEVRRKQNLYVEQYIYNKYYGKKLSKRKDRKSWGERQGILKFYMVRDINQSI